MSAEAPFRLLAISDRQGLADVSLPAWAAALARAGVPAVQLREKDLADRACFELLRLLRGVLPSSQLLANGRADLALAAGADGVHLPADGVPTSALRSRFGDRLLLGRSTHTVEEVAREAASGADYVTFGPVFASPGKTAPVGLGALADATRLGVPVLALGGIGVEELPRVAAAGAAGAAGIRLFRDLARLPAVVAAANEAFAA